MAENKKKRKWLSTNALKEFINDITEEELNAEERYNETNQVEEFFDLEDEQEELSGHFDERIQEPLPSNGKEEQLKPQQLDKNTSDELKVLEEKYDAVFRKSEAEKEELREKLNFERIRLADALKERDEQWKNEVSALEEERNQLHQQLSETQHELTELINADLDKEAALQEFRDLTCQFEELNENYQTIQKQNQHYENEIEQLNKQVQQDHTQSKQVEQLKKDTEELAHDYQQLHTLNQTNEMKMTELREENETLLELLEEKEQGVDAEVKRLEEKNLRYKQMIQQLQEQQAKKALEDTHMDVGEQGQVVQETGTENLEQLTGEKEALNSALFDAHEEIAKLEEKTSALEQLEAEKDRLASRLADAQIELSKLKEQKNAEESLELIQAKKQVDELTEKNEQLKKEVVQSQQEIGEVLISAKKQANRTVEEAQAEAKHMISSAELELENISNRAKKILIEVSESRKSVLSIYDDLEFKVEALSNGALLKEIKKNKQEHSDYFDTGRN